MHQARDPDIRSIRAQDGFRCYGMGLGIILLDDVYPGFPGDVRNASAYPFPIQYEIAEGVDIPQLVLAEDKSPCLPPVQRAAQKLERLGCRAIATECGYFAYFQRELAASVNVPVFSSALLQVPLAQQLVGPDRVVGILAAQAQNLTDHHLESVGIRPGSNYIVGGAMDEFRCEEFDHLWTKELRTNPPAADYEKAKPNLWQKPCASTGLTSRWARWSWNVPGSRRLRARFNMRFGFPCSVGGLCWIMRIRSSCTATTTGTSER
jgi:hypothetical protein